MQKEGVREFDPQLDLVLERVVDVPVALVWRAWTEPEHLMQWFAPVPWSVSACNIDLRPGGIFQTTMRSPEGDEHPGTCCYLEVIPETRLVWSSALLPGFRPAGKQDLPFTAIIEMEAKGAGTHYRATAMHVDPAGRERHAAMGFVDGWGKALEQLVAHAHKILKA